jgi:UDP-glucuronate 4-epimerase
MDRAQEREFIVGQKILVTGAAGFIGFHVATALMAAGLDVVGVDNVNDYYPSALKRRRLALLEGPKFSFHEADIADFDKLKGLKGVLDADVIVHLAAQAGVRYSIQNPFAYARSNLVGHLSILELARAKTTRLVYASSSSVYGTNRKIPFSETDPVVRPASLYAATKIADEMMSESYARLYGIPQTGLRFFTVYGPWGRPDMAYWTFTDDILAGKPIRVFNKGDMQRDFTYIDDIVKAIVAIATRPPKFLGEAPHRIYNIGNNRPETLGRFIEIIENAVGRKAEKIYEPMQDGDVPTTYADIDALAADYEFNPSTPLDVGIPKFVDWFKAWRAGKA